MKNWVTSLNGAITLSAIAFILSIARTFLDFQFVFSETAPDVGTVALAIGFYTVVFGGWLWALLASVKGSRAGLIAALLFALLLPFGGGIATFTAFCPSPCATVGGLMEIANWANLITGLLAAAAAALHLRQTPIQ
jgi:hypothetical protein